MKKKLRLIVTVAIETEPTAIDHIGVKQGLNALKDKIDYLLLDPLRKTDEEFVEQVIAFKPDVVIHYMDTMLSRGIPQRIADKIKCKQVFWEMDYSPICENTEQSYEGQWMKWKNQFEYIDHIFLSNKGQLEDWKKYFEVDTSFLPHGCYVFDKPQYDKQYKYPCVFIGGMVDGKWFDIRKKLLEEIMRKIDVTHLNKPEFENRKEIWTNMPKIYHSSDTVLDISHFWSDPGYASGRYFYTAGLGGCSITKRFPDCEELYPEGTKIYFDEPEECVEKVQYYQIHETERENVKLAAFEYNKIHHNFKLRFETILKQLNL